MTDVTRISNAIERGNARASDELPPLAGKELHIVTAQRLTHEPPGQTFQATAQVRAVHTQPVKEETDAGTAAVISSRQLKPRGGFSQTTPGEKERLRHGVCHDQMGPAGADVTIEKAADDLSVLDKAFAKFAQEDPVKADLVKVGLLCRSDLGADWSGPGCAAGHGQLVLILRPCTALLRDRRGRLNDPPSHRALLELSCHFS